MTTQEPVSFIRRAGALGGPGSGLLALTLFVAALGTANTAQAVECSQTITANVVVFDNPTVFNRLGAQNPNWITYALERDVVDKSSQTPCSETQCSAGSVELRRDKRPRPLVIRSVAGACLTVNFKNLLDPVANPKNQLTDNPAPNPPPFEGTDFILDNNDQVAGRCAGFHASGTELVNSMADDGSMVGANPGADATANPLACGDAGLVAPGQSTTYHLYTPQEGAYVINSYGATLGSEASSGNLGVGMFGALNVQPKGARMYRSQVTEEELRLATKKDALGNPLTNPGDCTGPSEEGNWHGVDCDPGGQPLIDYEAVYPPTEPWVSEGKAGLPVLNMLTASGELVHSDINAIIAGPDSDGSWESVCPGGDDCPYPLERVGKRNPVLPNRLEAFREFTSIYHDEQTNAQVFPLWYEDPVLSYTLAGVRDSFMINYGSGGIGSEIIANRLHTGPMHDCTDCAYEEFFLSSQTVGDPGLLVNFPANTGIESCDPKAIAGPDCWRDPINLANGPIAGNFALFQEDPSNVHHAYTGDFTKIRNIHAGAFEQHIFHLHNHQWLFNPNDDNSNYLDAQEIMPGSGHTYELVNGGVGNRNKTAGDAIFHCHFYPHFAQGMWYHIRIQDTFETGSVLEVSVGEDTNADGMIDIGDDADGDGFHDTPFALRSGKPAAGSRALPDGELPDGVPIPAIVPLPGKGMPQMPANVEVMAVDRGQHSLLGGRSGPDNIPDSSQAIVDFNSVKGADGVHGTPDDVSPGFPFWLAGVTCGEGGNKATGACPEGIVGQRMMTPPLDMLTEAGASDPALNPALVDADADGYVDDPEAPDWSGLGGGWDGGLPRHALLGYVSGGLSKDTQNRLDFRKIVELAKPVFYPEVGTKLEKLSMAYQAVRERPTVANMLDGAPLDENAVFVLNGSAAVPGGPFQDPCVDDLGQFLRAGDDKPWSWHNGTSDGDGPRFNFGGIVGGISPFDGENPRTYKLANVQIDAVFNKLGHHYSQERIIALWEDVAPSVTKERPPEPLVMRYNSFDCGKLLHANLVPAEYELDDFQVRTPTDIIGQHIHLPKWDLTTNDGAANGWNYEDGTLSPGMVRERIVAINHFNEYAGTVIPAGTLPGQLAPIDLSGEAPVRTLTVAEGADPGSMVTIRHPAGTTHLEAEEHYFNEFTDGVLNPQVAAGMYVGARTTIQRILIDPVFNAAGEDRGLGLTFSHDHYGPSTFQQIGLYSTILAEPRGSAWYHNESGAQLGWLPDGTQGEGGRDDGGPTSWQAVIETDDALTPYVEDHREFYFEMSDFQHAYVAQAPGDYIGADQFGIPKILPNVDEANRANGIFQPDPFDATRAYADPLQETWLDSINPVLKLRESAFPDIVAAHAGCPGPGTGPNGPGHPTNKDPDVPRPCAEAINIGHESTWVVNYRNEPVGQRVFDPSRKGPDGQNGAQTDGPAGDLALAFQSRNDRAISQFNTRFGDTPYPTNPGYCDGNDGDYINCDRNIGDPFTPIIRAYEGDPIKIKIQVGATEEQHQTTIHGIKWLSNGSGFGRAPNSGWRNFQSHGISEQFSLQVPLNPALRQAGQTVDYLYAQDATRDGIWLGTWGIMRSYGKSRGDLAPLPDRGPGGQDITFTNAKDFTGVCPKDAPVTSFDISAVLANEVLGRTLDYTGDGTPDVITISANAQVVDPATGLVLGGDADGDGNADNAGGTLDPNGGTLVYNRRGTVVPGVMAGEGAEAEFLPGGAGPLNDPTAMMYVRTDDLVSVAEAAATPFDEGGACFNPRGRNAGKFNPTLSGCAEDLAAKGVTLDGCLTSGGSYNSKLATCPVVLRKDAPVEPLVLRANAGDCIDMTLRNRLVNEQAVTKSGQKVYYADGTPVFADLGKGLGWYLDDLVTSVNRADVILDLPPDLPGYQDMMWGVTRRIQPNADTGLPEMLFFNNNLVRPGSYAGIHPQLVEYDASRDDGVAVGRNQPQLARPGGTSTARYYAGHIEFVEDTSGGGKGGKGGGNGVKYAIKATPVEFGGSNLVSADRVKQPQKGLFGALVIEPEGACHPDSAASATCVPPALDRVPDGQGSGNATRETRAQATIVAPTGGAGSGGTYREAIAQGHRIANLRWVDGTAIRNINQGELGREGAEDSGHAGFNYGMEPSWFRYQLPPDVPFGNAGTPNSYGSIPNPQALYANELVVGENNAVPGIADISEAGDPATPVFRTDPGMATRIHLLNGASADRDGTFILHGHVWQRDPYVCPNDSYWGLPGMCDPTKPGFVASPALGLNPLGKYMGGEEGLGHVFGHWPILFNAGGTHQVQGDYLYRDYSPGGNRNGQFGILRVGDPAPEAPAP